MEISCIIHTYNSEGTLEKALKSVTWADDLIVVDMESEDNTLSIARQFDARLFSHPRVSMVDGIRNKYLDYAVYDWIFVLDSDEYLAEDVENNVRRLIEKHKDRYDAFAIPRFNLIAGQIMRGSNWYPDHQIRLLRKGTVRWSNTTHMVPEVITGPHRVMSLQPPHCLHIHHDNYRDLRHFVHKQLDYALNDRYDADPSGFDFSDYIARAYEKLALHEDIENDGDLSHALSLIMAWDAVIRGIIHWDSLVPRPPLDYLKALPTAYGKVPRFKIALRKWALRHYPIALVLKHLVDYARGLFRFKKK